MLQILKMISTILLNLRYLFLRLGIDVLHVHKTSIYIVVLFISGQSSYEIFSSTLQIIVSYAKHK